MAGRVVHYGTGEPGEPDGGNVTVPPRVASSQEFYAQNFQQDHLPAESIAAQEADANAPNPEEQEEEAPKARKAAQNKARKTSGSK